MPDDRLSGRTESVDPNVGRGEIPFVWVQDDATGHRYDVAETAIGEGVTRVPGVPLNWTESARPPKYRTDKGGEAPSAAPDAPPATEAAPVSGLAAAPVEAPSSDDTNARKGNTK